MSSDSGDSDGHGHGFKLKHKDKKDKDKKDKKDKDKKDKKDKDKKDKDKKDKKDKDKDKKDKHDEHSGSHSGFGGGSHFAMGGGAASEFLSSSGHGDYRSHSDAGAYSGAPPPYPPPHDQSHGFMPPPVDFKSPSQFAGGPPLPPPHPTMSSQAPPSGYRVPLRTDSAFPPTDQCGPPVAYDADGVSPIYIGSALFESSVQPCKIGPHLQPTHVALAYGGREVNHDGRYDLLPFVPDQMEWVPAQYGQIPPGRRPVEGGYEENGSKLYHAISNVNGIRVPGKTGEHLGAANVPFGGQEHPVEQYEVLCWRY